ncbi:CIA30 family protein [Longibacter salinarum]|uniref:CIA30 family protein n=1 Tax=Longibacter salinarum TaxID=1850348 RepID=A0A2A8CZ37_9BACT|nr:CIA30 family protein [Longibacter salinarum]PEN13837.1 CIA30 family protein [Longibacter salinarum]
MTTSFTTEKVLFDARHSAGEGPAANTNWHVVNDTVMGGVSESSFARTDEGARFSGTVSLDHGGGFASVRAPERNTDISNATGFLIETRGDGKTYKWTAYTDTAGPVSYRASFTPSGEWQEIFLPFTDLIPFRRGHQLDSAPPFDASHLRTFGILISDRQAGPFQIDLRTVAAVRRHPDEG